MAWESSPIQYLKPALLSTPKMEHYEQLKDSLKRCYNFPFFFRWEVVSIPWGFVWAAFNLGFDTNRFIFAAAHLGPHGETLDCSPEASGK